MTITEDRPHISVGARQRADILSFASRLCSPAERREATAVSAAAEPLLEWAGEASGRDGLRARMEAMWQQHNNSAFLGPRVAPAEFVAQSRIHYAFITGGN